MIGYRTTRSGGIPDWETVNARVPLTKGMLELMARIARQPIGLPSTKIERDDRDRLRALHSRKYAEADQAGWWKLTDLGAKALADQGKAVT